MLSESYIVSLRRRPRSHIRGGSNSASSKPRPQRRGGSAWLSASNQTGEAAHSGSCGVDLPVVVVVQPILALRVLARWGELVLAVRIVRVVDLAVAIVVDAVVAFQGGNQLVDLGVGLIVSCGEDGTGEFYVVDHADAEIYQLWPRADEAGTPG